jgi:hypothetical protein
MLPFQRPQTLGVRDRYPATLLAPPRHGLCWHMMLTAHRAALVEGLGLGQHPKHWLFCKSLPLHRPSRRSVITLTDRLVVL